ncbi:MAG: homoserine dehydrogenase [Clostridia bacterium]|nr:homoserine dehydrogenase [Clostridia bacterium]
MAKVAILGFGTVGSGVYEVLNENAEGIEKRAGEPITVSHILDIRDFSNHPHSELFTKDFEDILADKEVTVIAEVIGGKTFAFDYTKKALMAGKNVVTSNKELVATHGAELLKLAQENGVKYLFEASVGGGIPIIHPMYTCLAANEISEIFGILNGTTNYILTQMIQNGQSFDVALKNAQELGYAEANPSADVDGIDACRKIAILADLAFGKQLSPDKIYTEGITNIDLSDVKYAEKLDSVIKLIGYCKKDEDEVFARVSPMLIPKGTALANTSDVFNAILVRGNAIGDVMFYGRGAGKLPTASAVVSDIIEIAVGNCAKIMWENCGDDFMKDISSETASFVVRADKSFTEDKAKEIFGNITVIDTDGEFVFATNSVKEALMAETAKNYPIKKYIRRF